MVLRKFGSVNDKTVLISKTLLVETLFLHSKTYILTVTMLHFDFIMSTTVTM